MVRLTRSSPAVVERPERLPDHAPARVQKPAAPPIITVSGLTKSFDDATVIDGLSFEVTPGEICGLIGPSGCGKTTTVRLLLGLLKPSSGSVSVFGWDPTQFSSRQRERIGYTPQGFFLYPTLTVIENARFVAGLYGLGMFRRRRRIREVLQFLELWDARHRLARDVSGGMQRRLELACAMFHRPKLLFVDEPTAGLDPVLRAKVWDHLRALCDQGATVFVTTQYIDEAEYCDTVAILNQGRLAAHATPEELRRRALDGEEVEVQTDGVDRPTMVALLSLDGVQSVQRAGRGRLLLTVDEASTTMPLITAALQQRHIAVHAVQPRVPSFEEVFMKIVESHG
jgi:ABC-2 type transport system ATP-binding protein